MSLIKYKENKLALKTENILVIPADKFDSKYMNCTFNTIDYTHLEVILKNFLFKTRYMMEEDTTYKQIIPYVLIVNEKNEILTYQRSAKGGENRLHNMYSIGVGGHLDENKENQHETGMEVYLDGMIREIEEEINIKTNRDDFEIKATIYDDSNEVGKVHFGVVSFLRIDSKEFMHDGEMDILINREFLTIEELSNRHDSLENWSKIIVENKELIF